MRRLFAGLLGLALAMTLVAGCGGGREGRHGRATPQPTALEPTPDTTPVEALRTPAGLALKPESTPTPSAGSTPSATGAAATATPAGAVTR